MMIHGGEDQWNNNNNNNHNHPINRRQEWNQPDEGMQQLQPQDEFYSPYATPHKHQPPHSISSSTEDDDAHPAPVFVRNDNVNQFDGPVMEVEEVKPFHCVGVVWYAYTTD